MELLLFAALFSLKIVQDIRKRGIKRRFNKLEAYTMILQGTSQSLCQLSLLLCLSYSSITNTFLVILVYYSCLCFYKTGFYGLTVLVTITLFWQY